MYPFPGEYLRPIQFKYTAELISYHFITFSNFLWSVVKPFHYAWIESQHYYSHEKSIVLRCLCLYNNYQNKSVNCGKTPNTSYWNMSNDVNSGNKLLFYYFIDKQKTLDKLFQWQTWHSQSNSSMTVRISLCTYKSGWL